MTKLEELKRFCAAKRMGKKNYDEEFDTDYREVKAWMMVEERIFQAIEEAKCSQ